MQLSNLAKPILFIAVIATILSLSGCSDSGESDEDSSSSSAISSSSSSSVMANSSASSSSTGAQAQKRPCFPGEKEALSNCTYN